MAGRALEHCVVKVVDGTDGDYDAKGAIESHLRALGADVKQRFTTKVTHVVIIQHSNQDDSETLAEVLFSTSKASFFVLDYILVVCAFMALLPHRLKKRGCKLLKCTLDIQFLF
jgi:hypothetical protein